MLLKGTKRDHATDKMDPSGVKRPYGFAWVSDIFCFSNVSLALKNRILAAVL